MMSIVVVVVIMVGVSVFVFWDTKSVPRNLH